MGIPEGKPVAISKAFPQFLIAQSQKIVAVAVGNRQEAIETLEMAARGIIKTHFRTEKLEDLNAVFEEMHSGKLLGRVVLDLQ